MSILHRLLSILGIDASDGGCHGDGDRHIDGTSGKVIIVGSPNVGKSMVFNGLTGAYVTVSNYPGTTVDVARGKMKVDGRQFEIIDTPGMYSLLPITEEERVARLMLFKEKPDALLHVVDARNLERMLPLTLQLIEADLPVLLNLNMMDEAETAGMEIDVSQLEEQLGIPVTTTVATAGRGIDSLRRRLGEYVVNRKCANAV